VAEDKIQPENFGKLLSYVEMALGAVLLAPFVPSRLAGVGRGSSPGPCSPCTCGPPA
jgi:hypothetical protein